MSSDTARFVEHLEVAAQVRGAGLFVVGGQRCLAEGESGGGSLGVRVCAHIRLCVHACVCVCVVCVCVCLGSPLLISCLSLLPDSCHRLESQLTHL